jgi:hypothetical protein
MIRRACLLALVVMAIAVSIASADDPSTLAAYQRAVEQSTALIDRAATEQNSAQRQSLIDQAIVQLGAISQVQASSGERWSVNNEQLLADLNAAKSDTQPSDRLQNIAARLRTLRAALITPPVAANESDRAKLRDILNQPPFKTGAASNALNDLLNQISDWLDRFLNSTSSGIVGLRDGITVLGFIFVAIVLFFFLRTWMSNWVAETQLPASVEGAALTSGTALVQAQRLASRGDYRTAVRQLYLASLLLLDERGVLRYDRTLTNREYLNAVKNEPKTRSALEPIVDTFDRTWYGFGTVDQAEFEKYQRQVESLKEL